jgi:putative redox protein
MKIAYKTQKKFTVTHRGHQIIVDQPLEKDGTDQGLTPPELFIASLATCMGAYIINYFDNTGLNANDMLISINWEKAPNPARIAEIKIDIELPRIETSDKKAAIVKVAEHCLVNNTIQGAPEISINLV